MADLIADKMSDNEALRRIVAMLDAVINWILGKYTKTVGDSLELTEGELTTIRNAKDNALKTVVTNTSEVRVQVYEGGYTVGILGPDQTWESPLAGRLTIKAKALDGDGSVDVTTYLKP